MFASAHLILVDLTGCNPNVCYEVGIAHALGKRVALVSENPQSCRIDFGALPVCEFDATQAGRERMLGELRTFVDTPGTLSPIGFFPGGLAVAGQPLTIRRFAAFLLDLSIAGLMGAVLAGLTYWLNPTLITGYADRTVMPVMFLYLLLTSVFLGTTPGQRVLGLKVTRLDRSAPSLAQRFLRPIAALLNLMSLGIGFLWAARAPRHQAVHDSITRTLVLRRTTTG